MSTHHLTTNITVNTDEDALKRADTFKTCNSKLCNTSIPKDENSLGEEIEVNIVGSFYINEINPKGSPRSNKEHRMKEPPSPSAWCRKSYSGDGTIKSRSFEEHVMNVDTLPNEVEENNYSSREKRQNRIKEFFFPSAHLRNNGTSVQTHQLRAFEKSEMVSNTMSTSEEHNPPRVRRRNKIKNILSPSTCQRNKSIGVTACKSRTFDKSEMNEETNYHDSCGVENPSVLNKTFNFNEFSFDNSSRGKGQINNIIDHRDSPRLVEEIENFYLKQRCSQVDRKSMFCRPSLSDNYVSTFQNKNVAFVDEDPYVTQHKDNESLSSMSELTSYADMIAINNYDETKDDVPTTSSGHQLEVMNDNDEQQVHKIDGSFELSKESSPDTSNDSIDESLAISMKDDEDVGLSESLKRKIESRDSPTKDGSYTLVGTSDDHDKIGDRNDYYDQNESKLDLNDEYEGCIGTLDNIRMNKQVFHLHFSSKGEDDALQNTPANYVDVTQKKDVPLPLPYDDVAPLERFKKRQSLKSNQKHPISILKTKVKDEENRRYVDRSTRYNIQNTKPKPILMQKTLMTLNNKARVEILYKNAKDLPISAKSKFDGNVHTGIIGLKGNNKNRSTTRVKVSSTRIYSNGSMMKTRKK